MAFQSIFDALSSTVRFDTFFNPLVNSVTSPLPHPLPIHKTFELNLQHMKEQQFEAIKRNPLTNNLTICQLTARDSQRCTKDLSANAVPPAPVSPVIKPIPQPSQETADSPPPAVESKKNNIQGFIPPLPTPEPVPPPSVQTQTTAASLVSPTEAAISHAPLAPAFQSPSPIAGTLVGLSIHPSNPTSPTNPSLACKGSLPPGLPGASDALTPDHSGSFKDVSPTPQEPEIIGSEDFRTRKKRSGPPDIPKYPTTLGSTPSPLPPS